MSNNSEHDTLLAHLAWMFSSHHEDIAVEALGYILQSELARRALVALVQGAGADLDTLSEVQTQAIGPDAARPDLACTDEGGRDCLLIEAKFWAYLTDNQPNSYLDRLPEGGVLLFVAPQSRVDDLWTEIQDRVSIDCLTSTPGSPVRSLICRESRHLMLASWNHLLNHLEVRVDPHERADIQQLRGLTDGANSAVHVKQAPVGPNELDLSSLVRDAAAGAAAAGCASTSGLRVTRRQAGYGRYLLVAGAGAWLGVDTEHWKCDPGPNTPLWLHFEPWRFELSVPFQQVLCAFEAHGKSEAIIDKKNVFVPLRLPEEVKIDQVSDFFERVKGSVQVHPFPHHVEYDEVLRRVVDGIETVASIISSVQSAPDKDR